MAPKRRLVFERSASHRATPRDGSDAARPTPRPHAPRRDPNSPRFRRRLPRCDWGATERACASTGLPRWIHQDGTSQGEANKKNVYFCKKNVASQKIRKSPGQFHRNISADNSITAAPAFKVKCAGDGFPSKSLCFDWFSRESMAPACAVVCHSRLVVRLAGMLTISS